MGEEKSSKPSTVGEEKSLFQFRSIPSLITSDFALTEEPSWRLGNNLSSSRRRGNKIRCGILTNFASLSVAIRRDRRESEFNSGNGGVGGAFASVSVAEKVVPKEEDKFVPTSAQLSKNPIVFLSFVPKDAMMFFAGAFAGDRELNKTNDCKEMVVIA